MKDGSPSESGWLLYLKGMVMGFSDVVPGVSGGTMALILGVYRRLVSSLDGVDGRLVRVGLKWLAYPVDSDRFHHVLSEGRRAGVPFLLILFLGIGSAFGLGVLFLPPLIDAYTVQVMAAFIGLILCSAWVPLRRGVQLQPGWTRGMTVWFVVGLGMGMAVALVPGVHTLTHEWVEVEAEGRSLERVLEDHPRALDTETIQAHPENRHLEESLPGQATVLVPVVPLWIVPVLGAIAVSALVLPGISGAYILLLLGGYTYLLQTGRGFLHGLGSGEVAWNLLLIVLTFVAGAIVGVKLLCRGLRRSIARFPGSTFAALSGLMLGALVAIWPYQSEGTPVWPGWGTVSLEVLPWFALAAAGSLLLVITWELNLRSTGERNS